MSRYINADALEEAIQKFPYGYRGVIKSVIAQMPTADAVPVVRCRDCKYGIEWDERLCCEWHGFYSTEPDWYCADGERREDGVH